MHTDEDYAPATVLSASLGEARYGGNLTAFITGGWDSRTNRTVAGVADGVGRVRWPWI